MMDGAGGGCPSAGSQRPWAGDRVVRWEAWKSFIRGFESRPALHLLTRQYYQSLFLDGLSLASITAATAYRTVRSPLGCCTPSATASPDSHARAIHHDSSGSQE